MGLLAEFLRSDIQAAYPPDNYGPSSDPANQFWYDKTPGGWAQGNSFAFSAPEVAMHVSAFFNGIRIIAETLAQPKLILYQRDLNNPDQKEKARNNTLFSVLHDQPNAFQTSYEYRVQQMQWLLLQGNAYSRIEGGVRGAVEGLVPLAANHMTPVKLPNGRIGYPYREEDGTETNYTQDEIFHLRGFPLSMDGVTGLSALAFARQTTSLALATEAFGAKLFENGAMHRVTLSVPGQLNKEQREAIREEIKKVHAGAGGWHSAMILANGTTATPVSMSADDAQFLLTRKFEIVEVARWLNIPPHLLKDLDRATFSNIEQQGLEFLQLTMLPWFINWEQAIQRDLIVQKKRLFAEFLVDSLVRADMQSRYTAFATGINAGFLTRNEVRSKENMNSARGLDEFLVDQNKATVNKLGEVEPISQPAQPAPKQIPDRREAPADDDEAGAMAHYKELLQGNGRQVMRKFGSAMVKALSKYQDKPDRLEAWADEFYTEQAQFVADVMKIEGDRARTFAEREKHRFLLSVKDNCVKSLVDEIEKNGASTLVDFVNERAA